MSKKDTNTKNSGCKNKSLKRFSAKINLMKSN